MLNSWARSGGPKDMAMWMEKMLAAGITPNSETCSVAVKTFTEAGDFAAASHWYKVIGEEGVYPKVDAVLAAVNACLRYRNPTAAKVWLKCLEKDVHVDSRAFPSALSAYARLGDVAGATAVVQKVEASGGVVDVRAHTSMLHACAKAGDLEALGHWLEKMQERGITFDTCACNTVMNAYAKANDLERTVKIFEHIALRGPQPDDVSYAILAKAYAATGNVEKTEEVVEEMVSKGMQARDHHLSAVLLAYGTVQPWRPDEAAASFRRWTASGAEVTRPVILALARAVGWARCNQIVGSSQRRRLIARTH
eukprot:NODE_9096_length_1447_cov_3.354545.p1 GENE.NODE_9096_length_1447_cov_3.354545~~NODE_9096_length_1447_cov_3.354545.p1  ORF type:complete len:309 (+),score=79.26 NODE_9096_length_1447_cov_3.354545:311-1237(+)